MLEQSVDDEVDIQQDRGGMVKGDVQFKQVSFHYPQTKHKVLENINFQVKSGEKIGILGETGSGKTTLLHLIPYLYHPSAGNIYIDGSKIEEVGNKIRRDVTLVPQEGFLFSGTIKDNITWGGNEHLSIEQAEQVAKEAQLHEFIMTLPNKYQTIIGQRGVNLSGGQKQRLSIARALADDPKILLLDDSTSALDATTEMRVLEAINRRECTTFIVSQKISTVLDADQIIVLEKGRIVGIGKHDQLVRSNLLYQKMWQSQQKEEVILDA